jgi:hypothetical protein
MDNGAGVVETRTSARFKEKNYGFIKKTAQSED